METKEEIKLVISMFLAGIVLGFAFGAFAGTLSSDGTHDYHAVRTVSQSSNVQLRAVVSPCYTDDKTIETLINGKLVSRTKPANFDSIWEAAK